MWKYGPSSDFEVKIEKRATLMMDKVKVCSFNINDGLVQDGHCRFRNKINPYLRMKHPWLCHDVYRKIQEELQLSMDEKDIPYMRPSWMKVRLDRLYYKPDLEFPWELWGTSRRSAAMTIEELLLLVDKQGKKTRPMNVYKGTCLWRERFQKNSGFHILAFKARLLVKIVERRMTFEEFEKSLEILSNLCSNGFYPRKDDIGRWTEHFDPNNPKKIVQMLENLVYPITLDEDRLTDIPILSQKDIHTQHVVRREGLE